MQFIHVLAGASTLAIKKHVQGYLDWQNPESFEEKIILMSMFKDIEWTKKGSKEACLHNATEVSAFVTQVMVEWKPKRTQGK